MGQVSTYKFTHGGGRCRRVRKVWARVTRWRGGRTASTAAASVSAMLRKRAPARAAQPRLGRRRRFRVQAFDTHPPGPWGR